MTMQDTICAPATIPGTGAISVIRISGPETFSVAGKVVSVKGGVQAMVGYSMRLGRIESPDGNLLDEVIVSAFRAPASYTGEDSIEISCHASAYIVHEILSLLIAAGARSAQPGEFTKRAFLNGKMDLAQAEGVAEVIASADAASHRVAMTQLKGGYSRELLDIRAALLRIVTLVELELDFSEEDVQFADRQELIKLLDGALRHIHSLADSFRLGNAVKNGIPVAIVGAANAGKSTLLNALLGEDRAIVSSIAGTTRDTVEEVMNIDGVRFRLIDTAGLRDTSEVIEQQGIRRALKKLSEASVVLAVLDLSVPSEEICESIRLVLEKTDTATQQLVFLLNKCDVGVEGDFSRFGIPQWATVITISALRGTGLDRLRTALADIGKAITGNGDATLVTNLRHYEALVNAAGALENVKTGISNDIPTDLLAQDIREALWHLGTITGTITTDEILGEVFKGFCVGK